MRTTLTIDDDVLAAARSRAELENRSIGDVLSELARTALRGTVTTATRNGLPILRRAHRGEVVTLEIVNALRDDKA
jgi:hypothetical protein